MAETEALFVTELYKGALEDPALLDALAAEIDALALDDGAGRQWSQRNGYAGYTSYASLNDLPWRSPAFKALVKRLDKHVAAFAKTLELDLQGRKLVCDSLWANVLEPGGAHSGHIHPHSVISGTLYVTTPPGSGPIKFEDPRLPAMMAAPPRKAKAEPRRRAFVYVEPEAGLVLLWESWLRHEVTPNRAETARVSVSFNYRW